MGIFFQSMTFYFFFSSYDKLHKFSVVLENIGKGIWSIWNIQIPLYANILIDRYLWCTVSIATKSIELSSLIIHCIKKSSNYLFVKQLNMHIWILNI